MERKIKHAVEGNLEVSRREYVKYAGAGIAAVAVAAAGAYYFGRPTVTPIPSPTVTQTTTITTESTTTATPVITPINPVVVEYGDKFPVEVVEKIKVIGEDYKITDDEKVLLDYLYDIESRREELKRRFDVSKLENTLVDVSIEDDTISAEAASAIKYMQRNRTDVQLNLINYGLNKKSFELLESIIIKKDVDKINPDLVFEVVRLKDFQTNEDMMDLIFKLYQDENYRPAFDSMLLEGISWGRRSLPHLEATSWIYMDRGEETLKSLLRPYSPMKLIITGWKGTKISRNYKSDRWKDVREVTDRLVTPKLIEMYMQDNLSYSYIRGEAEGVKTVEQIFTDKKGACYDHALFAAYCLKKNGYNAMGMAVKFKRKLRNFFIGHIVCLYEDLDSKYYTIDVWELKDKIYGPFESIKDAAEFSTHGQGLKGYTLHSIDLETGKYTSKWY